MQNGSLYWYGCLTVCGSLVLIGFLITDGSLSRFGCLGVNGSLSCSGCLVSAGSLEVLGCLQGNGSLPVFARHPSAALPALDAQVVRIREGVRIELKRRFVDCLRQGHGVENAPE